MCVGSCNTKRNKKGEEGNVLTEMALFASVIAVVSLSALPSLETALKSLQTAQYNASIINNSYPPPLIITTKTVVVPTGITTSSDTLLSIP